MITNRSTWWEHNWTKQTNLSTWRRNNWCLVQEMLLCEWCLCPGYKQSASLSGDQIEKQTTECPSCNTFTILSWLFNFRQYGWYHQNHCVLVLILYTEPTLESILCLGIYWSGGGSGKKRKTHNLTHCFTLLGNRGDGGEVLKFYFKTCKPSLLYLKKWNDLLALKNEKWIFCFA